MKRNFFTFTIAFLTVLFGIFVAIAMFIKKISFKSFRSFKDEEEPKEREELKEKLEDEIISENSKEWEVFSLE